MILYDFINDLYDFIWFYMILLMTYMILYDFINDLYDFIWFYMILYDFINDLYDFIWFLYDFINDFIIWLMKYWYCIIWLYYMALWMTTNWWLVFFEYACIFHWHTGIIRKLSSRFLPVVTLWVCVSIIIHCSYVALLCTRIHYYPLWLSTYPLLSTIITLW